MNIFYASGFHPLRIVGRRKAKGPNGWSKDEGTYFSMSCAYLIPIGCFLVVIGYNFLHISTRQTGVLPLRQPSPTQDGKSRPVLNWLGVTACQQMKVTGVHNIRTLSPGHF